MKRFSVLSLLVIFLILCALGCSGKSSSLEGKVVDGKGQPLASVKVTAKMSQPISGYEKFETMTGTDGTFKFGKLYPASEYQLILFSKRWTTEQNIKTDSGPEGQTKILPEPVIVRFMDDPKKGVLLDTKTGLMWAVLDNHTDTDWDYARRYCENYRIGGFSDWRLPTLDELASLYDSSIDGKNACHLTRHITLSKCSSWALEIRGFEAANFAFDNGNRRWIRSSIFIDNRVLPVRSGK